jgi:hypothetical protein
VSRRLALRALLLEDQPDDGWSTRALERAAGVERRGLHNVLRGALAWGLIELNDHGKWQVLEHEPSIADPLRKLLVVVELAPELDLPADLPPQR